jgi:phospholipase C
MNRCFALHQAVLACLLCLSAFTSIGCGSSSSFAPPGAENSSNTVTPIHHVVIVIGENRSFDNLFATYQPPAAGQSVFNLLSEGIVKTDGSPGPNFQQAAQQQATDTPADEFMLSPPQTGSFTTLPQPSMGLNLLLTPYSLEYGILSEPGLSQQDQYLLHQGGFLGRFSPDPRLSAATNNGPYNITSFSYDFNLFNYQPGYRKLNTKDNTGDPMHRFYQNWQQNDCSVAHATKNNPSGCLHDLYAWVAVTVGWGTLDTPPPANFDQDTTFQGGTAMGFYNMANGDLPFMKSLADGYALSDNYHQFMFGGTGPNSITTGTAAPLIYSDANGNPATPPADQIENPNAYDDKGYYPNNNNWYWNDGFWIANTGNASNGSYSNCADTAQPGVAAIRNYLNSLPYKPFNGGNCQPLPGSNSTVGYYYLLNNQLPSYTRIGGGQPPEEVSHTVGPSSVPTIGDALSASHVTWHYYGDGFSSQLLYSHYCDICNPFQYSRSIMTTDLKNNIVDLNSFFTDVKNNTLPAVSYIKPDDIVDGHPGTSTPAMFDAFVKNIVQTVKANPDVWDSTAILITTDESGGLYDSGYIQPIDFFGDGPRIMLLVVSKYARTGSVDHTYSDHASLLKFIEYNWSLQPLSATSRDNLPNPAPGPTPYIPGNSPAVGDLTTLFNF